MRVPVPIVSVPVGHAGVKPDPTIVVEVLVSMTTSLGVVPSCTASVSIPGPPARAANGL